MAEQEELDPYMAVGEEEVHRLIRENSHIFTDTQCKVCSAVLISESQKLAHYQSKKHANKTRRYMAQLQEGESSAKKLKIDGSIDLSSSNGAEDRNKCCPICNMSFSAPVVAASHYEGKTHSKNLRLKEQGPPVTGMARVPTTPIRSSNNPLDPEKYCTLCSASFNNPLMAQQHYSGKKHKKQESKNKLAGGFQLPPSVAAAIASQVPPPVQSGNQKTYPCEDCNITLNSTEQYQAHISGSKHKANVHAKRTSGVPYVEHGDPVQRMRPPDKWYPNPYQPENVRGDDGYYSRDY
ncbi:zinc finger protein 346 [Lissotriton helveticus]